MIKSIWLWQNIISPHMVGLAEALADRGISITYVANRQMSSEREAQGWNTPKLQKCKCKIVANIDDIDKLIQSAPEDSIHLCQGIRGNGLVAHVQQGLAKRKLRQWVLMETVDDYGAYNIFKRLIYRYLFKRHLNRIDGILAIGYTTPKWVIKRGFPESRVYPFTYFLPALHSEAFLKKTKHTPYRFLFVGQLIPLKRLKFLVESLAKINKHNFELGVVGTGPKEGEYREHAEKFLGKRLVWKGKKMRPEVANEMLESDCLILPSRYDGWGAVVSESLMLGTPVIVSDRCGSAGIVNSANNGKVFKADCQKDLIDKLNKMLDDGKISIKKRQYITDWSKCITAPAGAAYLEEILRHKYQGGIKPTPPWETRKNQHEI